LYSIAVLLETSRCKCAKHSRSIYRFNGYGIDWKIWQ